ncbi:hypothetical protein BV22DRAFT_1188198 [Leucogyrophana mollusca]|uniref:Uncharacterized protein n=1 Tax=Leucogyrophana mollusca TaxID=85980 RepID=A0ACB8AVY3_9AGAM|nr:hypothetical protein BV22DRAFT_1188198 [Leucogyrophana mollusca]
MAIVSPAALFVLCKLCPLMIMDFYVHVVDALEALHHAHSSEIRAYQSRNSEATHLVADLSQAKGEVEEGVLAYGEGRVAGRGELLTGQSEVIEILVLRPPSVFLGSGTGVGRGLSDTQAVLATWREGTRGAPSGDPAKLMDCLRWSTTRLDHTPSDPWCWIVRDHIASAHSQALGGLVAEGIEDEVERQAVWNPRTYARGAPSEARFPSGSVHGGGL